MTNHKKLRRSQQNRLIGGVLGGIADYFGWNVTLTRIIFILITLSPFPGILFYILAWILIPDAQDSKISKDNYYKDITPDD
ncbi:PspC domain-containing protein [Leuconostoc palmae]|uniref:PspC domain-containing protein n=1 Tax=Leuconostoc palmae TaxID=501487 RepID=UPI001C7E0858|nr:PspC domain-containing protein [Leuconostoc palmae]